jgi:chromosome segregation ATPase
VCKENTDGALILILTLSLCNSAVLDVALEVCDVGDSDTTAAHADDVWDTVLSLTRKSASNRRKSLDPPQQDTPHVWQEYNKHAALSNLLSVAVSHRDLQLRKSYIERIMTLPSGTQRLLMALIEKRKKVINRNRTSSSKKDRHYSSGTKKGSKSINKSSPTTGSSPIVDNSITHTPAATYTRESIPISTPSIPSYMGNVHDSQQSETPNTHNNNKSLSARSPFRLRKTSTNGKFDQIQTRHIASSNNEFQGRMETTDEKKKSDKRGGFLSTPSFLRRTYNEDGGLTADGGESARRNFHHDSFVSPQEHASERRFPSLLPPPSSERVQKVGTSLFSPGLGDTAEFESQVQNLRDEKDDLTRELAKSRQKEEELSRKMEDVETSFKKEILKIEREARDRDDRTKEEYQNHIKQMQTELVHITDECVKTRAERDELLKIKDEMEVMSHAKSLLEETTERLRTYKEKVQQLSDFKEALHREEEAHSRSVEENLRLQNELHSLQPLKRQLEEYKARVVDAEVKYTDCQDELTKLKEQKGITFDVNTQMEQYVLAQEEEIKELRRRVQQNEQASKLDSGVGDGMSELNPELKAEVLSLRNENAQLRAFADKRENDEVTKLEQEAEDKARLAERYKSQFLSTKDQLEMTQASFQESRTREAKLRSDLSESLAKIQEAQEEIEDLSSQLLKCNVDINQSLTRESKLEEELSTWAGEAKTLQEHANDVSRRLKKSHIELEESLNRESSFLQELESFKKSLSVSEQKNIELSVALELKITELEQSQTRESQLEMSVNEWTDRTLESHEHAKDVSAQLMRCNSDLEASKQAEATLSADLIEMNNLKNMAEQRNEVLSEDLKGLNETLENTRLQLEQSKLREIQLRDEITDLACRVEDAEGVSKQRMELVQNTRDRLQATEDKITSLEHEKEELVSSVALWTSRAREAAMNSESLDSELDETRRALNDTEEKQAEAQGRVIHMTTEIESLTRDVEELRSVLATSESLTRQLQEELEQTQDMLATTQNDAKSLKAREELANEQLEHAEQMLFELEDAVESEVQARDEMVSKIEELEADLQKAETDLKSREKELLEELDSEKGRGNTIQVEVGNMKETLNALQSSLSAAQHREKMMKHELSKMKDIQQETERSVSEAKEQLERTVQESARSLESVREKLAEKAQKDLEEVQQNMNQLLEDERRAKRQQEEILDEKVTKLCEKHESEIIRLKQDGKDEVEKFKKEYDLEFHRLKGTYEEKLLVAERSANEEKSKLMTKGKGMLAELKEKMSKEIENLTDDVAFLEEKIMKEEEDKKNLGIQFQTKLVEYKKKLQVATSRINTLSSDNNDFEERVQHLERERSKLREENDRYRRQLGGRSGSDSVLEAQLETLQVEFKSALEENRELKRKLKGQGQSILPSIGEDNSTRGYMRNGSNQSTLTQLRTEYEETIDSLNGEKRELVMKNSAAITDVQKAEKRAWLVEQENAKLKQDLTSLKLSNERLENMLSNVNEGLEHDANVSSMSNVSISDFTAIPLPPSGDESDAERYAQARHRTSTRDITGGSENTFSRSVQNKMETSMNSKSNDDWDDVHNFRVLARNQSVSNSSSQPHNANYLNTATPGGKTTRFQSSSSGPVCSSPDPDIKSFVQSATLHTPYKSTGMSKGD